jgi:predicted Na+-dependent transporter
VALLAAGAVLPAGLAAVLVLVRPTVPNTNLALVVIAAVLAIAMAKARWATAVAALSAALSVELFHAVPYEPLATAVVGLLALAVGLTAARTSEHHVGVVMVLGAAVVSQAVPEPARFLVDHGGLDVCLAVLVFATALAIPSNAYRGLAINAGRLSAAVVSSAVLLPGLAWVVSRLVPTLALRRGVLTVGLAPAEVASVATTSLAGGDAAIAAGMLVGSTLITVAAAGVALRLLGGGAVHLLPILTSLCLVVGAPMAAGIAVRTKVPLPEQQEAVADRVSLTMVIILVWLVASTVRLSGSYFAVTGALLLFIAGSAILGTALGYRTPSSIATALLLTTSMRDFAIAAGIAVAAFGAASAAPLGIYGVMVISWGTAVASLRSRSTH